MNEAILNKWVVSDLLCNVKFKDFCKTKICKNLKRMDANIYFTDYKIFKNVLKKDNPGNFLFVMKKKENFIPKIKKKNYLSIVLENLKDPVI